MTNFIKGVGIVTLFSIVNGIIINITLDGVVQKAKEARQETQRETMLMILQHGGTADYIIPSGEYKGESATGFCIDEQGTKQLLESI